MIGSGKRFGAKIVSIAILTCLLFGMTSVWAGNSLSAVIVKTNSWTDGNQVKTQYSVSINNNTTSAVSNWSIAITVLSGSSIGKSDGWNANYSIAGTTLTITPVDYNKEISAGASIGDIGFILTSSEDQELSGTVTATSGAGATTPSPTVSQSDTTNATTETGEADNTSVDVSLAAADDDWLHTDGSKILDENGTEVWLTGINWFGYNTGTNIFDGVWNCNMEEALKAIADHGFNLLRIPISTELVLEWKNGTYPEANFNQALNPELVGMNSEEIFAYAISICKENGIKVMLDIHCAQTDSMGHMVNLWYTDSISTQDYYDSLTYLADKFKDDDTVVAFDLKNEPHGKPTEDCAIWNDSTDENNWKYVAETAGNLVLDINPNVLIVIEGIEIYPIDISTNGDFSSTNSADYYFDWWGGNLRGVKDYPVDFGSADRNDQIVYSPHDYGPAVYEQPWFEGDYTYESLQEDCWNDNWLYIEKDDIAPLLIGEWGGYMTQPNLTWMTYLRQLILEYHINYTFWCFNANSGDTGGLVKDDFTTWDEEKYAFVKEVLWQEDGKFVGLDHVIPLGQSGNGISLSVLSGPITSSDEVTDASKPVATSSDSSAEETGKASPTCEVLATESATGKSHSGKTDPLMAWIIGGGAILLIAAVGVTLYVYASKKRKKSSHATIDSEVKEK